MITQYKGVEVYLSSDNKKFIILNDIIAFSFFVPQDYENLKTTALRCVTRGGDLWFEDKDAIELHDFLIKKINNND